MEVPVSGLLDIGLRQNIWTAGVSLAFDTGVACLGSCPNLKMVLHQSAPKPSRLSDPVVEQNLGINRSIADMLVQSGPYRHLVDWRHLGSFMNGFGSK